MTDTDAYNEDNKKEGMVMKIRRPLAVAASVSLGIMLTTFGPEAHGGEAARTRIAATAQTTKLAQTSVLLSVAMAGSRLVAVGERGHVLLSDDDGATWRQAPVPTNVTLTAVRFASAQVGWAVGHFGVILHTRDGGETWVHQFDGVLAAKAVMAAAESGGSAQRLKLARLWMDDGPDKPFLTLSVMDERTILVFGAYGLAFRTEDAGATWTPIDELLNNPRALHINASTVIGGRIFLVGELGLIRRSDDGGQSFATISSPYNGTLFDVAGGPAGDVMIAGLRGHAFLSGNGSDSWTACGIPMGESLTAALHIPDGRYLFASSGGRLLMADSTCRTLFPVTVSTTGPLAGLALRKGDGLAMVGMAGYLGLQIPPLPIEAGK